MTGPIPFPDQTPARPEWEHRVRTFGISITVDPRAPAHALVPMASRALAEELIKNFSIYSAGSGTDAFGRIHHHYKVSAVLPIEGRNLFAEQLDQEREAGFRAGIAAATAKLHRSAKVMDELGAGLIAFNLRQASDDIAGLKPEATA